MGREQVKHVHGTREHFFFFLHQSRSAELQQIIGALKGKAYVFLCFISNYITLLAFNTLFYSGPVAFHTPKNESTREINSKALCNRVAWENVFTGIY